MWQIFWQDSWWALHDSCSMIYLNCISRELIAACVVFSCLIVGHGLFADPSDLVPPHADIQKKIYQQAANWS
jgi:hypothetical protein